MHCNHILLKIKTSRTSEETESSTIQFLATLSKLHNNVFNKLIGNYENLSLEIFTSKQKISFLAYVPLRILSYFKGAIQASYPKAVIEELDFDPISYFYGNESRCGLASLKLSKDDGSPLKTYEEFAGIDSLSTLISILSKNDSNDSILIQMILNPNVYYSSQLLSFKFSSYSQQKVIDEKANIKSIEVTFKLAAISDTSKKSKLLLESIASAYQAMTGDSGNSLHFKNQLLFKRSFLKQMEKRSFKLSPKLNLSLKEIATIFHFPTKKLSNIENISWGQKITRRTTRKFTYYK